MFQFNVPLGNLVLDEEITSLDVLGALGAGECPIGLQQNGTLVILLDNVVVNCVPLSFDEILGPQSLGEGIIYPDEFVFSGTLTLDFFFLRSLSLLLYPVTS